MMEDMENKGITVRKLTEEEKEQELKKQMEIEYQREQLRQIKRERTSRVKSLYSGRKKRGLLAIAITAVILIVAILIQVLIATEVLNATVGTGITAVLAILSFAIIKMLRLDGR